MLRGQLLEQVRESLAKTGFFLTPRHAERGLCFDVVARRDRTLLFVKVLQNIDAFGKHNAEELKFISQILGGSPVVVGERSGTGGLEDGVIYSRFGVPIISVRTFLDYFEEGVPPFIYSAPGGLYVRLDTQALRRAREAHRLSLGALAEVAGVSRRTIQMYLEGMSATMDIAMRLEEFIGEALAVPVDPFAVAPERAPFPDFLARLRGLERDVFARLERLGYEVLPIIRSPFDAFTQHEETTLLTGVGEGDVTIERKAETVANLSRVIEKGAVLFARQRRTRVTIRGIPIIGRDELRRAKDLESVEELIAERTG